MLLLSIDDVCYLYGYIVSIFQKKFLTACSFNATI